MFISFSEECVDFPGEPGTDALQLLQILLRGLAEPADVTEAGEQGLFLHRPDAGNLVQDRAEIVFPLDLTVIG